jgi:hypothetical protein
MLLRRNTAKTVLILSFVLIKGDGLVGKGDRIRLLAEG